MLPGAPLADVTNRKRKADESASNASGGVLKQTPVEKHDSGFFGPMGLFASNPHNDTFEECRHVKLRAIPEDFDAETYTFVYRGTPFGLIKSSEAALECNMSIRLLANQQNGYNAAPDGDGGAGGNGLQAVSVVPIPLKTMFKSKEIYINDELINNNTNSDDYISWIRHLSTQVKTGYKDSDQINIASHKTPGHSDSTANIYHANANNVGNANYCVNRGAYRIARMFNNGANVRVIDDFDGACFNENGSDKYLPSDFNIKINLHRNVKTKYLHTTAVVGATVVLQLRELTL